MCLRNIETSAGKTRGYLVGEVTVFVLYKWWKWTWSYRRSCFDSRSDSHSQQGSVFVLAVGRDL